MRAVAKETELDLKLTAGEWYLRYMCANCESTHILFRDLTHGTGQVRATYLIECPTCRHRQAYDSDHIERYHYLLDT